MPPPPNSTLFPYTTLFRSLTLTTSSRRRSRRGSSGSTRSRPLAPPCSLFRSILTDRKSTRLNSSHLGISYAVFCLKKKNHEQRRARIVGQQPPRKDGPERS